MPQEVTRQNGFKESFVLAVRADFGEEQFSSCCIEHADAFVAEELFRPLRSTKDGGFGIGAYQARELMRDLGGDILVKSKIGEGTRVTLTLPLPEPSEILAT